MKGKTEISNKGEKMKKIGSLLVLSAILTSVAFANVDGFSDIENVVTQGSDSAQATLGVILKWLFAIVLPFGCAVASAIYGFIQTKQKFDQSQQGSPAKLALITVGYAILGGFAYYLVASLISGVMFGDFGKVVEIINQFFNDAVA